MAKVVVVENHSDTEFERYTLRIVEHLVCSKKLSVPPINVQFTYLRKRGCSWATAAQLSCDYEEIEYDAVPLQQISASRA
jgi:hypothetical protein